MVAAAMKLRALLLLMAMLWPATLPQALDLPPFVTALQSAPTVSASPADASTRWMLAFIDVETTGLVPGWHEMIDIGVVMTELDGTPVDEFFLRIQPAHPERLDPGAFRVNAFSPMRWRELGAVDAADVIARLRAFHHATAGSRPVLMVAFNSPFDAAFLDHLFRATGGTWRELYHYFVLDIPSMAWSLGIRGLTGRALAEALGVEDEPRVAEEHTGLTGAQLNARLYRAMEARRLNPAGEE
jgi:DNA polymerase III epsilon subunit-like protein